jgi:SPP1 family holin
MFEKLKSVSAGVLARTVALFLAILNAGLSMAGVNPIPYSETGLYEAFTAVWLAASSLTAWWRNNGFTKAARVADGIMKTAKETGNIPITYNADVNSDLLPGEKGGE